MSYFKKYNSNTAIIITLLSIFFMLFPEPAEAHIKWFVEFDLSDPPQSIFSFKLYYLALLVLSIMGVFFACAIDSFWYKKMGNINPLEKYFSDYDDIALKIARLGTGIFFVGIWLVGWTILTPELYTDLWYIPYLQLFIAISVMFKRGLFFAGIGILLLYAQGVYDYGLFHMTDYITLVGLAVYLMLSSFNSDKYEKFRLPILYFGLIFSFLWSALEKIAFPNFFYPFLEQYKFLTLGLDVDFFIASAAFIEFTLFFLLLTSRNGLFLLVFLINLLVTLGNVYFGKMDAIGHFPANFILLIMLIKGPLPIRNLFLIKNLFMDHSLNTYNFAKKGIIIYLTIFSIFLTSYYGFHWAMYQ